MRVQLGRMKHDQTNAKQHDNEMQKPCRSWVCKCECGNEIIVAECRLVSGEVTDCGCQSGLKPDAIH